MRSGSAGLLTCAEASSCDGLSNRAVPSAFKIFILTLSPHQSQQALHQEAASLIMRDHASPGCDGRAAGGGLLDGDWSLHEGIWHGYAEHGTQVAHGSLRGCVLGRAQHPRPQGRLCRVEAQRPVRPCPSVWLVPGMVPHQLSCSVHSFTVSTPGFTFVDLCTISTAPVLQRMCLLDVTGLLC